MLEYQKKALAGKSVSRLYFMSPFQKASKTVGNWKSLIALLQIKAELKDTWT